MPRRKKDAIIPLPNELKKEVEEVKQDETSLTKVEIALQKVKKSKQQKPKTIIVEEESDEDDIEYVIQPIFQKPIVQQPQPVQQQSQPVQQQPQPVQQPVVQDVVKPKRKYTRKPKTDTEVSQQNANANANPNPNPNMYYNNDILKQIDILKKENDYLKSQNSLSNISRLNTMARTMKILF